MARTQTGWRSWSTKAMSIQCDRLEINGQFAIEFIEVSGRRVGTSTSERRLSSDRRGRYMTQWQRQRCGRDDRLEAGRHYAKGKIVPSANAKALLEAVIHPPDRVCLEGDNQKQADF